MYINGKGNTMFNKRIRYDIDKFRFKELLEELYRTKQLDELHLSLHRDYSIPDGVDGLGKDTSSEYHSMFYNRVREGWSEFTEMYHHFLKDCVIPNINDKIVIYQTLPSYRIQYPSSKAITTLHHDSDVNHRHPVGEINILLPITKMFDSNTIWAESAPNSKDFAPMNAEYGEFIVWDGNKCNHYNKVNKTGKTRISMDFRVLPSEHYNSNYILDSATTGKRFIIGDYYSLITEKV